MRVASLRDSSYSVHTQMSVKAPGNKRDFTPAVPLLCAYDLIVASFTRESKWRTALLRQLDPRPSDIIADIGCGTGSFLALIGKSVKSVRLIGIDPDSRILLRAGRKFAAAGLTAKFSQGYLRDSRTLLVG